MADRAEARRKKPPNRHGCKPVEDVCVEHDMPLVCRHGCEAAREHECADRESPSGDGGGKDPGERVG